MSFTEALFELIRPSNAGRVSRTKRRAPKKILLAPLARSGGGKTATTMAEAQSVEGCHLLSGLLLRGQSLLDIADREDRIRSLIEQARDGRIPSTQRLLWTNNLLYDGDAPVLEVEKFDPIGQRLTETRSSSDESDLADFHQLQTLYANANVLQVMIPMLPADPTDADEKRFAKDLTVSMTFLHEALVNSKTGSPRAVVIVPTKLDCLWVSAAAAQSELSDQALRVMFAPLINVINRSDRVDFAAITPTSAFGFGNTRIEGSTVERATYHGEDEDLGILMGELQPFNVITMVVWSLLAGLRCLNDSSMSDVESNLRDDLASLNGWVVPIKGQL